MKHKKYKFLASGKQIWDVEILKVECEIKRTVQNDIICETKYYETEKYYMLEWHFMLYTGYYKKSGNYVKQDLQNA